MSKTEASVASHLLEAERVATMLADSVRRQDGLAAIAAEHDKAIRAVVDATRIDTSTRSALANFGSFTDSLTAARAAMGPPAATAMAVAVDRNNATQKALDATGAGASALSALGRHTDSFATLGAALKPNVATALAVAVDHNNSIQKAIGATRADGSTLSALTSVGLKTESLAALGATLDPGVDKVAKILHGQFADITSALKAHRVGAAALSHRQLSETVRQLSMRPDLAAVAEGAASLIQSVGLSKALTSDIQHVARAASRVDYFADLENPRDSEPLSHYSPLNEILEPSLEEADFNLLLSLVVLAVFPALWATSMAHMTQAVQDLLFVVRVLGKLTQVDDAIPGVLLLGAIIRSLRRPQGRP